MPKYNRDYFEEKFPHLLEEIENREEIVGIDGVRTSSEEGERASKNKESSGPNIIDFIRLCDTEDDAIEIISYMEKEGKIDAEYAKELRQQIMHKGLRSFGSKRNPGEYSFEEEESE